MSALGQYIHLYYSHYRDYGVAHINETPKIANYSLSVIERRIKNQVRDIKKEAINELQRRLKLNSQSNLEKGKTEQAALQQKLLDEVYSLLYERLTKVEDIDRLRQKAGGNYWSIDENKNRVHTLREAHWATSLSVDELKKRRNQAKQIYQKIQKLIKEINDQKSQQSLDKLLQLQRLYEKYTHLSYDSNQHTLVAIQKAIKQHRYNNTKAQVSGDFGQMVVATLGDKIFKEVNQTVAQAVEQSVKGKQKTEIFIDKSLISQNRGDSIFKQTTKDGTQYYIKPTQNKVDVEIQIMDEDVLASVKTYSGTTGYSFRPDIQEVNLFYSILFLNSYSGLEDIGNHWLNLHTTHPGKASRITNNQIDDIIKKQVAFQALSSGNPFKTNINKANVFIYINRDTGQVYVKSIKDILFNDFSKIGGLNVISKIFLQNHRSEKIEDRITNVLNQLHQKNLSIALNIKFD